MTEKEKYANISILIKQEDKKICGRNYSISKAGRKQQKELKEPERETDWRTDWRLELEEVEEMIRDSWIETKGNHIIVWAD